MEIAEPIRAHLSPGEQILWAGVPRKGIVFRGSDVFVIPFSMLWTGFAVFWLMAAAASGAPLPFVLFGVPFVLVGGYMVIGRFAVEAWQREHTFYALTAERVLIASGLFSKKVKSLNLKTITEISLAERRDGTGVITFGAQHPMAGAFGSMSAWPGVEQYLGPRFDLVADPKTVYNAVRKAQSAAQ